MSEVKLFFWFLLSWKNFLALYSMTINVVIGLFEKKKLIIKLSRKYLIFT